MVLLLSLYSKKTCVKSASKIGVFCMQVKLNITCFPTNSAFNETFLCWCMDPGVTIYVKYLAYYLEHI